MWTRLLGLMLLWMPLLAVEDMCVSLKDQTFFISDRYRDLVRIDDRLYLVNEFGIIIKDANSNAPEPLDSISLGGDIQRIFHHGDRLYVTAAGEGVHRLRFEQGLSRPFYENFYAFPGLKAIAVNGDALAVVTEDAVSLYRYTRFPDTYRLLGSVSADVSALVMDANLLYLLGESNHLRVVPYSLEEGMGALSAALSLEGNLDFYDIDYHWDRLVLESLDGVVWAELDGTGKIQQTGRYFTNQGKNIVLASDISGPYLALRFTDRLELHQMDATGTKQLRRTLPIPFRELATTSFVLSDGYAYFMNQSQSGRGWSYRSLVVAAGPAAAVQEVPARYDQIVGALVVGDTLLAGSGQSLLRLNDDGSALELALDLKQPLVEMLGSQNRIYTLTRIAGTTNMQFSMFEVQEDGAVVELFSQRYAGKLSNLTALDGNVAFVRNFRHTRGDDYTIHAMLQDESAVFSEETYNVSVAIEEANPFQSLHLTSAGLLYKSGNQIALHDNLEILSNRKTFPEPNNRDIIELTYAKGLFWVETEQGLSVLRDGGNYLEEIGQFSNWQHIRRLNEDLLIARNVRDADPGNHYLLSLDDTGFVTSTVTFSTSENPFLIREQGNAIVVAEKASLSRFNLVCPPRTYRYMIPYREDFELELLPVQTQEVVTFQILNARNEVIGEQRMSSDILESFNGMPMLNWLYDYNRLEEPAAVNVAASTALAPIISGYASDDERSRFAYQALETTFAELVVPHIPSDFDSWNTSVFLRNDDLDQLTSLQLIGPEGPWWAQETPAGSTEAIRLSPELKPGFVPPAYALVASNNVQTQFSGFVMFEDERRGQAAAVPLSGAPSEFLILPFLKGFDDPEWRTGMVLANHNLSDVTIRLVGYAADGLTVVDRQITVAKQSKLVVLAEDLLSDLADGDQVKWFALVGDKPLTGLALLSHVETGQLAALPLTSANASRLRVNGIRSAESWWHELVLTNIDSLNGQILLSALDHHGEVLSKRILNIAPKDVLELQLEDIFTDLTPGERERVRALEVEATVDMSGFLLRGLLGQESLEAVSFYAEGF